MWLKSKLIILLIALPIFSYAQKKDLKFWAKRYKYTAPLMLVSGIADAHTEVLSHHYYKFHKKWGNENQKYWNPDLSWRNKWKNGNKEDGEKFFLSSSVLVSLTDAYHMTRTVEHLTTVGAVIIPILGKKQKTWVYIVDFLVISGIKSIGFTLTYDVFYE